LISVVRLKEEQVPEVWKGFLDAARRKAAVSAYFSERLAKAHREVEQPSTLPSTPIQAYFEGVVISSMAAVDQVALGVKKALGLRLPTDDLVSGAFAEVGKALPEVESWFNDPIGRDLRRIRTRIVHYSYSKSGGTGCRWVVEGADTQYEGSRELLDYAKAAATYAG
jgi:hypothetical protein